MTSIPRIEQALKYATELGWPVFPVHSIVDGVCTCTKGRVCDKPGKHPRTKHGFKAATTDEKRIRRWWKKNSEDNIGIATGEPSGLVVVDVDPKHGGVDSMQDLQERLGRLPGGPFTETGGGGWHFLFAHPGGRVPCRIGLAVGVDVRADGGYIVAPDSTHISGQTYKWAVPPDKPPPELPEKWLSFLLDGRPPSKVTEADPPLQRQAETVEDRRGPRKTVERHSGEASENPPKVVSSRLDSSRSVATTFVAAVENAIVTTLPRKPGTRHRCLFEFCRALQAVPGMKETPVDELKPYVKEWHKRALPNIVNAYDFVDEWEDFSESWDKVRYPRGEGVMVEVLERARAAPDARAAAEYESERMGVLVAICRELQSEAGDKPFYLSSSLAANLLGITPMRAWRWLRLLCREGRLEVVEKGNQRRATRYRYLGDV